MLSLKKNLISYLMLLGTESDGLAGKGVLYAQIEWTDGVHLHVFNTHLQASYGPLVRSSIVFGLISFIYCIRLPSRFV